MTYKGVNYNRPSCKYSGMTSVEYYDEMYLDSPHMCQPHDVSKRQSRSYYSHYTSFIIVLYWYEHYSIINATLEISQTKCQLMEINICMMMTLCVYGKFVNDTSQCDTYLERMTNGHIKFKRKFDNFWFSLKENKCIILHLNDKETTVVFGNNFLCEILVPSAFTLPGNEILYQIKASNIKLPFLTPDIPSKSCPYVAVMSFHGIVDEFCIPGKRHTLNCTKINITNKRHLTDTTNTFYGSKESFENLQLDT